MILKAMIITVLYEYLKHIGAGGFWEIAHEIKKYSNNTKKYDY